MATKRSRAVAAKMKAAKSDYAPPGDVPKGKGDTGNLPPWMKKFKKQG